MSRAGEKFSCVLSGAVGATVAVDMWSIAAFCFCVLLVILTHEIIDAITYFCSPDMPKGTQPPSQ